MRVLLVRREAGRVEIGSATDVSDFEHVRVVPMSGAGKGSPGILDERDFRNPVLPRAGSSTPCFPDVARGAPAIGQPRPVRRVINRGGAGKAENDVAAGFAQRLGHLPGVFDVIGRPVVFEIIETPFAKLRGIGHGKRVFADALVGFIIFEMRPTALGIVAGTSLETGKRGDPRTGIQAGLEAERMNLIAQRLHVGEAFVGLEGKIFAGAFSLPGVVNVDVGPAVVDEAGIDQGPRRAQDLLLVHRPGPAIPTVPTHRRRERDFFARDNPEILFIRALRVFGAQDHFVFAPLGERAGDASRDGVNGKPAGEFLDAEGHGPVAGGRDGIKERRIRADAEDVRAVDARRGGRRRCPDKRRVIRGMNRGNGQEHRQKRNENSQVFGHRFISSGENTGFLRPWRQIFCGLHEAPVHSAPPFFN